MSLEIKHVADLMGMKFRIPSYQRGYRWERKQIEQLLDDLAEFADSVKNARLLDQKNMMANKKDASRKLPADNEAEMGYYCLQPLAVTGQDDGLDIIDGQQRLTTIYLILYYLSTIDNKLPYDRDQKLSEKLYELRYESREDEFFKDKLFKGPVVRAVENIDFYFMTKAYAVIKEWFDGKSERQRAILNLLLPDEYKPDTGEKESNDLLLHDVRFIWYETPVASSIQTFNNLNYGKIGLTASELVKALLFECDQYDAAHRDIEKGIAFTRSLQWSAMEESLQEPFFWGMLVPEKDTMSVRLELILQFVAHDIDGQRQYTKRDHLNRDDADWVFNIFSKAISDSGLTDDSGLMDDRGATTDRISQRIEYLWGCIRKVYTVFRNWYDDRTLYHWIGLYILLAVHYGKQEQVTVIKELYDLYSSKLKNCFEDELKKKIGSLVRITANTTKSDETKSEDNGDHNSRIKKLEELNYQDGDGDAIRKILLLFNVELTLRNEHEQARFPFQLVAKSSIGLNSIEHIHPQNLDTDRLEYGVVQQWFDNRVGILKTYGKSAGTEPQSELSKAVRILNDNLVDSTTFDKNKPACVQALNIVDREFDELAGMKPEIMHTLYNLALVDQPTNSSLGNQLLDDKRKTLIEQFKNGTYIPLGTWYAFNKHFSEPPIADLKFWTKSDREKYFTEIKKIYTEFAGL